MKDVIDAEPLFSCVGCRDYYSWPASNLRVHEGCLWCDNCWSETDYNLEDRILWSELKPFVPAYATEIDELRKENEALKAHIERMREALWMVQTPVLLGQYTDAEFIENYGALGMDNYSRIVQAYAITPQQSLAAIRNETLERAAREVESMRKIGHAHAYKAGIVDAAEAIRAMKEQP